LGYNAFKRKLALAKSIYGIRIEGATVIDLKMLIDIALNELQLG
jgi:hypothetical protein